MSVITMLVVLSLIIAMAALRATATVTSITDVDVVSREQNKNRRGVIRRVFDFSKTPITIPDGDTYTIQLFKVEAGIVIKDMRIMIQTAEGEAATGEVGDGGDPDRFIDGAVASLDLNAAAGTILGMNNAATLAAYGHRYTADDTVDLVVANATGSPLTLGTGKFIVWADYNQE